MHIYTCKVAVNVTFLDALYINMWLCVDAGKPLQNQDILKAMLLENIPDRDQQAQRRWLVNKWSEVAKDLDALQDQLSNSYRTKAWKHSNGVSLKKIFRGSINLDPTLMDELLQCMRHLNDPERY